MQEAFNYFFEDEDKMMRYRESKVPFGEVHYPLFFLQNFIKPYDLYKLFFFVKALFSKF